MHYPLLSGPYVAALEGRHDFSAEAKRLGAPITSLPTTLVRPFSARETGSGDHWKDDDDMETARTRPLPLDQIHL